jgi:manganese/zinc/iron transport system permease protein
MGAILALNILFVSFFYKELKISTFDSSLAASFGFVPVALNYALMSIVSVTIVGAFDAVGVILVIALMISPAATAYMLTDRLKTMIILSMILGGIAALSGYFIARIMDASIAGVMATMCGVIFFLGYLLAPGRGLIANLRRKSRQKIEFAQMTLAIHIFNHSGADDDIEERMISKLDEHLGWEQQFIEKIVKRSVKSGLILVNDGIMSLTSKGGSFVEAANMLLNSRAHPGFATLRNEFIVFTDS